MTPERLKLADKIEAWSPEKWKPLTLIAHERRLAVAALRAIPTHDTDTGWQPIETAPKDGTPVDLFSISRRRWCNYRWDKEIRSGMWSLASAENRSWDDRPSLPPEGVTHWMPIPNEPCETACGCTDECSHKPECVFEKALRTSPPSQPDTGVREGGQRADELDSARAFLREKPSTSYVQRKLGIGYNRASRIMEQLEEEGFISRPNSEGMRTVLPALPPDAGDRK